MKLYSVHLKNAGNYDLQGIGKMKNKILVHSNLNERYHI